MHLSQQEERRGGMKEREETAKMEYLGMRRVGGVEEEGRTARSLLDTYLPATVIDASFAQPGGAQLKE